MFYSRANPLYPCTAPVTGRHLLRGGKKQLANMAWFRLTDTVLRVPCTPGAALVTSVRQVVEEEAGRLGLKVKVQEGAGVSLRRSVVTGELGAGQPCPLCLSGDGQGGLRHHRSSAVYCGDCLICGDLVARYWGESGDSGYCRTLQHMAAIEKRDEKNAVSKHLAIHHQEREGEVGAFRFTLEEIHSQALSRLCSESVHIHHDTCEVTMNSKAEWHQPVVPRVVATRELERTNRQYPQLGSPIGDNIKLWIGDIRES